MTGKKLQRYALSEIRYMRQYQRIDGDETKFCLSDDVESLESENAALTAQVAELQAKVAELSKSPPPLSDEVLLDAKRYRWLRDECDTSTGFLLSQRLEPSEWNVAIDDAMLAAREVGNG